MSVQSGAKCDQVEGQEVWEKEIKNPLHFQVPWPVLSGTLTEEKCCA
jgi:hypothetical protein